MLHHGFYILATEPLIISTICGYPFNINIPFSQKILGDFADDVPLPDSFQPQYTIEHVAGWTVPIPRIAKFKARQFAHTLAKRSHHLMLNASDEDWMRKAFLIRGGHFSHNLYINEHIYRILDEPKVYDAVYTAQLVAFKRLQLARSIERLTIVSYGGDLHSYCPELKHAEFNQSFLPRPELARKYNQSHVGLCLSAVEGAMLASCEYLLCGIPVVSTPSKGGRDEFFNAQNSSIVPPDPQLIASAVERWKTDPPDPAEIRAGVLRQIRSLRLGYCQYLGALIDRGGGGKKDPEYLVDRYFNNLDGIATRFVKFKDLDRVELDKYAI